LRRGRKEDRTDPAEQAKRVALKPGRCDDAVDADSIAGRTVDSCDDRDFESWRVFSGRDDYEPTARELGGRRIDDRIGGPGRQAPLELPREMART
jgi:hypothetical protein